MLGSSRPPVPARLPWRLRLSLALLGGLLGVSLVAWMLALLPSQPSAALPIHLPHQAPATESVLRALAGGDLSSETAKGLVAASASSSAMAPLTWQLQGVVVGPRGQGSALLVQGDGPAKLWQVGESPAEGLTLLRVTANGVALGDARTGQVVQQLTLPLAPMAPVTASQAR